MLKLNTTRTNGFASLDYSADWTRISFTFTVTDSVRGHAYSRHEYADFGDAVRHFEALSAELDRLEKSA